MKIKKYSLLIFFAIGAFVILGTDKAQASSTSCVGTGQSTCSTGQVCSGGACMASSHSCTPACVIGKTTCVNGACVASAVASTSPTTFTNPLKFKNVEGLLGGIMSAIQKIIVVLALVFIMIGAVMILASAGNSGMVEKGKESITMALVGLALGVAAPSLLKELAGIVGWGGETPDALTLSEIAINVLNFLLGSMGIIALIMLVIGAIMYLTSAGDEDRIEKGKEIFKYSLIGVLLAMASMVIVKQIAQFFV